MNELIQQRAFQIVRAERIRQDNKWGEQNHPPIYWMGILGEEFGELCEAVNESSFANADKPQLGGVQNMLTEASHVAAVAVSFMEFLLRYGDSCD